MVIRCFRCKILSYILLPFCFRYVHLYHKSQHKNLLELIKFSIQALMMSEFCWNKNFGFPYKISSVNDPSEQLVIS